MTLYLIRHAQSANNDLYDRTGSSLGRVEDPELTPLGGHQGVAWPVAPNRPVCGSPCTTPAFPTSISTRIMRL